MPIVMWGKRGGRDQINTNGSFVAGKIVKIIKNAAISNGCQKPRKY